jgi:hypothetical protein
MQADLLSSTRDDATDNILKALEVSSPQLVINLLTSHGFSEYVNTQGRSVVSWGDRRWPRH